MSGIHAIETFTGSRLNIVRVRTDDGREGIGQTARFNADVTAEILHRQVAPHALGFDADDIDGLAARCHEREAKFLGSYLARALAGVDTALWDLRAKQAGLSVAALLGATRDRIPVYGSYLRRDTRPQEVVAELKHARHRHGFRAFKVKIGKRRGRDADEWPGRTEELVASLARTFGPETDLLADANSCYGPEKAIEVGRLLEEHGFRQFEEPCHHQELEWTAQVAAALSLDVCGGEQDHDLAQFRRMIAMHAVDVVQPDVCYAGGFTAARRVGEMAAAAGLRCQPHSANRSMLLVFALHLYAAIPNPGPFVEYAVHPSPEDDALFAIPLVPQDGHLRLPERPGWGVEISPAWLRRARRRVSRRGGNRMGRFLRRVRARLR